MAKANAAMWVVFVVVAMVAAAASADDCNVGQLLVCAPAIISGSAASPNCCSNLKAQQGCLCQYARNPAYKQYVDSPNARKTLTSCGIPIPSCPPAFS